MDVGGGKEKKNFKLHFFLHTFSAAGLIPYRRIRYKFPLFFGGGGGGGGEGGREVQSAILKSGSIQIYCMYVVSEISHVAKTFTDCCAREMTIVAIGKGFGDMRLYQRLHRSLLTLQKCTPPLPPKDNSFLVFFLIKYVA